MVFFTSRLRDREMSKILDMLERAAGCVPRHGRGARPGELVVELWRFIAAGKRLEVFCDLYDAHDALAVRMIRRFGSLNLRNGVYNYRFFDRGPLQ
jgi:hypothetical protein